MESLLLIRSLCDATVINSSSLTVSDLYVITAFLDQLIRERSAHAFIFDDLVYACIRLTGQWLHCYSAGQNICLFTMEWFIVKPAPSWSASHLLYLYLEFEIKDCQYFVLYKLVFVMTVDCSTFHKGSLIWLLSQSFKITFIKVLKASLCWKLLSKQNPNTDYSVQIRRCFPR